MARILIYDGYNKETTIGPAHGHPPVWIAFRPALSERVATLRRTPKVSGADYIKELCLFLKDHLLKWDVEDAKGNRADHSDVDVLKLVPIVYLEAMVQEVSGEGLGARNWTATEDVKN